MPDLATALPMLAALLVIGAFAGTLYMHMIVEGGGTVTMGHLWIAILISIVAGTVYSAFHAFASINMFADQTISGTAINMFAGAFAIGDANDRLLDALAASGRRFALPDGSRILDTGGFKGQSRELGPDEFYDGLSTAFGVARSSCINMYGMTELSSQLYDNGNAVCPSVKSGPHWIRSRVVDPLTGADLPGGQRGVIVHHDLAHFNCVAAILTEDAGEIVPGGFKLLGRVDGEASKGCSVAVAEFLAAARG